MTPEEILASGILQGVNVTDFASSIRGMTELSQTEIAGLSDSIMRLGNGINQLQAIIKRMQTPTWLPFVRIGYPEDNPPLIADDSGNLIIQGNATIGGTVEATAFRLRQVNVLDMTLTDNSPSPGYIAWSACSVIFDGTQYTVASGNTDKKFVYWDTGAGSFLVADAFTPQIGRFLVATNDNGTADEAWNKVAGKGIQRDNIMFALLEGLQPESYDSGDVDLSTAADTQVIVDTTGTPGAGVVLAFSVHSTAALSADGDLKLRIQIDGATYYDVPIIVGGHTYHLFTKTIRSDGTGDGSNSGDWFSVQVPISYLVSVKATLLWVRSSPGIGTVQVNMWRASKVS